MNRVSLFGFLGRDFEMSATSNGKAVARNSLAITKSWTNASGNKEEHTDWIPLVLFDKSAENVNKFFKKGDRFLCEGEINTGTYTDEMGEKKFSFQVIVKKWYFIKNKEGNETIDTSTNPPKVPQIQSQTQTELKENELPSANEVQEIKPTQMPF